MVAVLDNNHYHAYPCSEDGDGGLVDIESISSEHAKGLNATFGEILLSIWM